MWRGMRAVQLCKVLPAQQAVQVRWSGAGESREAPRCCLAGALLMGKLAGPASQELWIPQEGGAPTQAHTAQLRPPQAE